MTLGARGRMAVTAFLAITAMSAATESRQFDHAYRDYSALLREVVRVPLVDYALLKRERGRLDQVVNALAMPATSVEQQWSREQRMAFWINAYNVLTLRAIVDHYPIRAGWFSRAPRNSIRQIDGVWTGLTWTVASRRVTLDDIEHRILRPQFKDARVHFAINCASISCPPLAVQPYRAETLDVQLDAAARAYLASSQGLRVSGGLFEVSRIFDWYGDDFVPQYAGVVETSRSARERAILGVLSRFAPPAIAATAGEASARVRFLDYDWSLNDIPH